MAFWGIEVKPGKPVKHQYDSERGRLHVSKATLGHGSSTERSSLQCNVGNKSPVLLCVLSENHTDNCSIDVEFEEEEEVVFSVLGPRSVHLIGYYMVPDRGPEEDTESYGEDIDVETEEESSYHSSDDEYEDDFIDDDDLDMFPDSPRPKSGVTIEEIIDDEVPSNGHVPKNLKKKLQKVESEDDCKDKQLSVIKRTRNQRIESDSEDEDGLPKPSIKDGGKDAKVAEAKENSGTANEEGEKETQVNGQDDVFPGSNRKLDGNEQVGAGKRKKRGQLDIPSDPSGAPVLESDGKKKKDKKKKKKKNKSENPISEKDQQIQEAQELTSGTPGQPSDIEGKRQESDERIPIESTDQANANLDGDVKKKRKKKKAKTQENDKSSDGVASAVVEEKSDMPLAKGARTFSNGLVVEDISIGQPDGKKADKGRKVLVNYIGKLKKNGKIFDSNIGKRPFKFRLGIGEVITGWDVGVKGMRVGDKRRLTIPPSMGYGSKGAGMIPPNAWLVFDVELVDVQ
ncbi:hypothetical protein AMTRI_Chr09g42080 [Amborella trichopoda]